MIPTSKFLNRLLLDLMLSIPFTLKRRAFVTSLSLHTFSHFSGRAYSPAPKMERDSSVARITVPTLTRTIALSYRQPSQST
jgi:hypothetical protein